MPTTPRKSKTITFSLPPEMAEHVRQVMQEEGRTMSELLREALRQYMDERQWRSLERSGWRRAREQGVAPEDVERLVDEYRTGARQDEQQRQGGETDE